MTLTDRRVQSRADRDDLAVARSDVHLAAGAAVGAGRLGPAVGVPRARIVLSSSARGTGIDAGAAADAGAVTQIGSGVRNNARLGAAIPSLPDELSLQLFADAHAAVAVDAAGHVDVNVGVGIVYQSRIRRPRHFVSKP